MTRAPSQSAATVPPMIWKTALSKGVAWLKWLCLPRITWRTMRTISPALATVITVPAHQPTRRPRGSNESIQASDRAYATNDTENLKGLVQIGTPTRIRSSVRMPTAETRARAPMEAANQINGRWNRSAGRLPERPSGPPGGFSADIRIPRGDYG